MSARRRIVSHHRHIDPNDRIRFGLHFRLASSQHRRRIHYCANDIWISRAPADVSGQSSLHFVLARIEIPVEQPLRGHHPAGGAKAAIGSHARVTDALQGMQVLLVPHPFDRENLFSGRFSRQRMAGIERRPIHQHTARAAARTITAPVRSHQTQLHGNDFPQCRAGFIFGNVKFAINNECRFLSGHRRDKSRRSRGCEKDRLPSDDSEGNTRAGGL